MLCVYLSEGSSRQRRVVWEAEAQEEGMWKTLGSLAGCTFPTSNLDLMAQVYKRKGLRVARVSR